MTLTFQKIVIMLLLGILCLQETGFAQKSKNLGFCIRQGLENNASLAASRFAVKSAEQDRKSVRADFLPSLSSSYSATALTSDSSSGPTETDYLDQNINTFNIRLSQILYAGSRIWNTYERAKYAEQASKARMNLDRLELIHNIEHTFYRLMKAKEDIVSSRESVSRLGESVKSAEAFFERQLVPYVDVLQARVDLADAREKLWIARNNAKRERVALFSLMNMAEDPAMTFNAQFKGLPEKENARFEDHLKFALTHRPDIEYLTLQCNIARKQVDISLGKYLPTVRLDLNYYDQDRDYEELGAYTNGTTYDRDQRNKYWTAGVTVSWDLFDGGRAWYEKGKFQSEENRFSALIQDAKNEISSGIRSALYAMSEAEQRLSSSADALNAAREYYEREEKRLKAGLSTIPSLLDAQDRLIRAQGNENHAVLDFYLAKSDLKLMRGDWKKKQ